MSKNEQSQKIADDEILFASQKPTDFVVDKNLADVQGAPLCNTAPPKYNETKILRSGIDSLYMSFHGSLRAPLVEQLQNLKDIAKEARCRGEQRAALQLASIPFKVHPKGQGIYPFVISNKHFHIRIAGESGSKAPPVYMQISSELLTLYGYDESLLMARTLADFILTGSNNGKISRVDLCSDFITSLNWLELDSRSWVCRSKTRHEYREANILTGYVFGSGGDVLSRLYDKTRELNTSEKFFFRDVWEKVGWDGEQTVWRLEFQVRQKFLKSVQGLNPEFFCEVMNSAWRYLSKDWLSLRLVQEKDVNRSRWPVNPHWNILQQAKFNLNAIYDIKRARFETFPSDYSIFTGALGYLTSFMVKNRCNTLEDALTKFHSAAERHFETDEQRRISLEHYVNKKVAEKQTKFVQLIQGVESEK